MPIYMDRHEMEGATAKAVADAHQKDLKLQEKYGIKLMTYWFDESRGSAFCLIDAPAKEKVRQLHEEAHGSIPHKIVEVNPETVAAKVDAGASFVVVGNHLEDKTNHADLKTFVDAAHKK